MRNRENVRTMPAMSVSNLTFRYPSRFVKNPEMVLTGINLSIEAGTILGILGPNGSGKSTLLKLLARVFSLQEGCIEFYGQDMQGLSQASIAKTVAFVPQETQQIFPFTIGEMVLMGRFPHHAGWGGWHWEDSEDQKIAERAMEDLDVAHLADRLITDVSGGERQRAIIARALTQEPRILLLDEPTAFLDLHHQLDIARILRRFNQDRGLTVVLVSHDLNLASQYCDQLLLLDRGQIVTTGTPEDVIRPEVLEQVYGCEVLIDRHPQSGMPRVSLPM
ncbi:MAG: ABC transporter ATP-binding protein [Nitrospirales bacterium]|nr:ABC transporter ATP-binding protein [Nitrospira sp.]MDR4502235.1 ABC transporter ATP-binding protein [Nitrospirales bacterium]